MMYELYLKKKIPYGYRTKMMKMDGSDDDGDVDRHILTLWKKSWLPKDITSKPYCSYGI